MKEKILLTARSFRKVPGPHQDILREAGYQLVESPHDRPLEADELAPLVRDVAGVVAGLDDFSAEAIDGAQKLRVISRYGVGVDKVDLKAATSCGIVVTITPGANSVAVAELTMGLILALARRIPYHDGVVKQGQWKRVSGVELSGATLGLIGLGRIGREVARRAVGFEMKILYHSRTTKRDLEIELGAEYVGLDHLLANADFVSLHCPLTRETHHLIGGRELALMRPTAALVNTARGGIVEERALYEALSQGKLAGAAFDVFAQEPPGDNPLLPLENFIATPHFGSATLQTTLGMGLMAAENALAVLRGERPEDVANPEVYSAGRD